MTMLATKPPTKDPKPKFDLIDPSKSQWPTVPRTTPVYNTSSRCTPPPPNTGRSREKYDTSLLRKEHLHIPEPGFLHCSPCVLYRWWLTFIAQQSRQKTKRIRAPQSGLRGHDA